MPEGIKGISVIMPAYNSSRYIRQSIKSILAQSHNDFEFLIINDGSADDTEQIIQSFSDPRIRYFKTEHKGTAAAMNYGISKAQNKWIARIDADDLNIPQRLETQVKYLNENPDIDILSSWSVYFNDRGKILFFLNPEIYHREIVKTMDLHNPINQSAMMFRKSIFRKNKYDEKCKYNEDFELLYRIRNTVNFHIIPEYLVYTRVSASSKSAGHRMDNIYDFLFNPAFRNLLDSKSKKDHFYWASVIAWINFFYGNRKESRNYFKTSVSFKNTIAYLATFLPDKAFEKLISYRLKYRVKALFTNKKYCYSILKRLINE